MGQSNKLGRERLEGEYLWDPQEMGAKEQGRLSQVFCCRAGE